MIDTKKLRDDMMRHGMKVLSHPKVTAIVTSPSFQKLMTVAFELPGKVQGHVDRTTKGVAGWLKLATLSELETLKAKIASLEARLKETPAEAPEQTPSA